jgi:predicted lipid-binding transport protein (Tim44 family)
MKALWPALIVILFSFTMTMEEAHAKRMGGGKSFGRSYQTAPAPSKSTADVPAQRQQADAAKPAQQGARKGGLMGGLLGGLLVGGLFAALFAGGAFEGLQLMDILIIAALAFIIFKVIRGLRQGPAVGRTSAPQPAYAGAGQQMPPQTAPQPVFGARREAPVAAPVSGSQAVPFNLPPGFDTPAFIEGAKEHYRILQDAWSRNDLPRIQEYVTPELYAELSAERASIATAPQTEVLSVNAELVRADQLFGNAEVSIRFSGRCRDAAEGVEEDFVDIWHLERDYTSHDAPWFITGMQSE